MCEAILFPVLVYSKLQLCRVNERTPRAAATTRGARAQTTAQYHSRVLETLPQPAYCYVGQTAAAAFFFKRRFLWNAKRKHIGTANDAITIYIHVDRAKVKRTATTQQRCNRHSTSIRGRDSWGSRASHGRMHLILGRDPPRRVPLESAEVSFARGRNSTSQ